MSYPGVDLELEQAIRHHVACGFEGPQEVHDHILESFDQADEDEVDALVTTAFAARDAAAAGWPAVTDCDRLDRAFAALEAAGVVARHNFTCCQTCGNAEIGDEIAGARARRRRVDGYVYYHMQDTDRAAADGELRLRYGGAADTETAAVGARVVAALREAGLAPAWDGDPARTIQVALAWQRRGAPAPVGAFADSVARWCAALPAATLGAAATHAGEDLPRALDAVGLHDTAHAWARAPFDDGDRACALARLATARLSPELLVEAWRVAPWGDRRGTFVTMLAEAGLPTPELIEIASAKIAESSTDVFRGAAMAWLAACAPELELARTRAHEHWQGRRDHEREEAVLALAAGLWRAGEDFGAEVRARFGRMGREWADRAALAAAPAPADVHALAEEFDASSYAPALRRGACRRLVELGAIDAARAFARYGEVYEAYVAWLTGDTATLATIAARADEHALQHEEGLIERDELRDLRIAAAVGIAARDQAGARRHLAELATRAGADALADGRDPARAWLAGRVPEPDLTADGTTLDEAIAMWPAGLPRRSWFRARRASRTILAHAAVHARRGELARARELVDVVLAPLAADDDVDDAIRDAALEGAAVEAWVALGDLDRVAAYLHQDYIGDRELGPVALGHYARALVAAGDRDRAAALLSDALDRADTRGDLLALLPGVLALAGDDAAPVHAAWDAADAALVALAVPS